MQKISPGGFGPVVLPLLLLLLTAGAAFAQDPQAGGLTIETLKKDAVKVYIAGDFYDLEYVKTEITYVNYVRDRKEADVHILITSQSTGGGGREYTLTFIGQNGFSDLQDIQKVYTEKTATQEEIRREMVRVLKLGLMAYVARTPIAARVAVTYREEPKAGLREDPWKGWLFSVSGNGYFNGEKSYTSSSLGANLSVNRVTAANKLRLGLSLSGSGSRYTFEDQTIDSDSDSWDGSGLYVVSVGEHWSVGGFAQSSSSSYRNTRLSMSLAPAVEYNVFPYSQSSRRQLRILYRLGFNPISYREVTIYEKNRQSLWQHALSATLSLKEKWGSISTSFSAAQYLHNVSFYNLNLFGTVNLNLTKGLSVYLIGGGSRIHDQLSLPKGELSLEEILLRRQQLKTSYEYFFIFGLSYTFGSIYTNVVNPRFGATGSGGVSIIIE